MKKLLAGILTMVMVLTLCACGGGGGAASTTQDSKEPEAEVEAEAEGEAEASAESALVGVAMPTKDLQRWNQDGENMKSMLEAAGYEVDLQ